MYIPTLSLFDVITICTDNFMFHFKYRKKTFVVYKLLFTFYSDDERQIW